MPRHLKLFAARPLLSYLNDSSDVVLAPMPPILCVPEIVRLITGYLDAPTLAAIARSRRALMGPASEQLYKSLDSSQLERLANQLLAYKPAPELGPNARVERFRELYAHYVQHLSIGKSFTPGKQKDQSIWRQLQRLMMIWPTETLFPHLRSLTCVADEPEQLETILRLLVSTLEELFVTGNSLPIVLEKDWSVPVSFLVSALPERCYMLRKLGLNVQATSLEHAATFEHAISQLAKLTVLECDYIAYHPSVFRRIAKLSQLTKLRIGWSDEFLWPDFGPPIPKLDDYFARLKSLCLDGTCAVLLGALHSIRSDLLELDIGITLTKLDDRAELILLAADIQSSYPNLRDLQCRIMDAAEQEPRNPHQAAVFSSFLRCKHIMRFGFSYTSIHSDKDQPLQLGNDDILTIAQAWPRLTDLRIECPIANPTALTIDCLGDLAKHCKDLVSLELPMICADDVCLPTCKGSPDRVISLSLKFSSFSNSSTVALYLSALWPNIRFQHTCAYCVPVKSLHEMLSYSKIMDRYEIGEVPRSAIEHLSPRYRMPFLVPL